MFVARVWVEIISLTVGRDMVGRCVVNGLRNLLLRGDEGAVPRFIVYLLLYGVETLVPGRLARCCGGRTSFSRSICLGTLIDYVVVVEEWG